MVWFFFFFRQEGENGYCVMCLEHYHEGANCLIKIQGTFYEQHHALSACVSNNVGSQFNKYKMNSCDRKNK